MSYNNVTFSQSSRIPSDPQAKKNNLCRIVELKKGLRFGKLKYLVIIAGERKIQTFEVRTRVFIKQLKRFR
jgi:hypothetical protein